MITAIVFGHAEVARIPDVATQIAGLEGVSEVYSVTGDIDLIALIRVRSIDQVSEVVTERLNRVPGVVDTVTHIERLDAGGYIHNPEIGGRTGLARMEYTFAPVPGGTLYEHCLVIRTSLPVSHYGAVFVIGMAALEKMCFPRQVFCKEMISPKPILQCLPILTFCSNKRFKSGLALYCRQKCFPDLIKGDVFDF